MEVVDCVVIGAGVVGLAVARSLALAGRDVLVLEAAHSIGTGISSRNSEVIHAGIYGTPGSLKSMLCVQGRRQLYDFCHLHGVSYQRCGKLIVANGAHQMGKLANLASLAKKNGVNDLVWLNQHQVSEIEPALACEAALLSPSTGIVDSHALMLAMQADVENARGTVVFNTTVSCASLSPYAIEIETADQTRLRCKCLVNAAGLQAITLAKKFEGLDARHPPNAYFAKGNYFTLTGASPFSHLIYPIPEPAGLGVHLTLDLGGRAKFGPDVQWVDSATDFDVDATRSHMFYSAIRSYWPGLQDNALTPAYAGIRPKLNGPGQPNIDFILQTAQVHGHPGLVNLFGIESPGLTSSLAIGEAVKDILSDR